VNVSTLKPFDEGEIKGYASGMKGVITAEEHSVIGGLSAAVAYALRGTGTPQESVAIADRFGQSALDYEELLEAYGLTEGQVARAVLRSLGQRESDRA
jgi:transketolase